jgi:hypothetical protein
LNKADFTDARGFGSCSSYPLAAAKFKEASALLTAFFGSKSILPLPTSNLKSNISKR